MARQTRAERRARREARAEQPQAAQPHGARERATGGERRAATAAVHSQQGHAERRGHFRFVRESWGELQKVEWPNQNQLVQGTIVVIVACVIVGFYLWGADQVFRRLVEQVFLGQ